MNSLVLPEVLQPRETSPQEAIAFETEGVQRYVWEGRFGSMLIEVVDGAAYVNGDRVEPIGHAGPQGLASPSS
jgi:hypothetical protein